MRLMLKRPLNDTWLDLDVQALDISYTEVLNGPGDITVKLPLSYHLKRAEDGGYVVSEYETLMIVENGYDGLVVALVDTVEVTATEMTVSGAGLSILAKGTPWMGEAKAYTDADAVRIFRDIWSYILSHPGAQVGLKITGDTSSSGSVGIPPTQAYIKAKRRMEALEKRRTEDAADLARREADLLAATKTLFKAAGLHTVGQVKMQKSAPSQKTDVIWIETDKMNETKVYKKGAWQTVTGVNAQILDWIWKESYRTNAARGLKETKAEYTKAKEKLKDLSDEAGEPYPLNWWATHDLAQKISELTEMGPFEFVERARWSGEDLSLSLEVGAPRIGARREELAFELGINVTEVPTFKQRDPYTDVLMLGAGEGSSTLRTHQAITDSQRVRRVQVITDKDATTKDQVRQASRRAIAPHKQDLDFTIDTVIVKDHAWARPSQYDIGDEIRITGHTSSGFYFDRWVRILEKTATSSSEDIILKVEVV